ncbi:MAG: penicillin-binding transpeptidase domain-containing protein [Nocardioides sp.]
MAWRMTGFPLDQVHIRAKTGSAEVHGKQSTSWVASYDENYVVVMMVSQGGTRLRYLRAGRAGHLGGAVRRRRRPGRPRPGGDPGVVPPRDLPTFARDGDILPPVAARGDRR